MMNSEKIEETAVRAIKEALEQSEYLKTHILEEDKLPSWDGEIFIYSQTNLEKEYLTHTIKIQVKGTYKQKLTNEDIIKYPADIRDLRNYARDGGVIYFVVEMTDTRNYRVYYASLLPFYLGNVLRVEELKQKTLSIGLQAFPADDIDEIEYILKDFSQNSKLQRETTQKAELRFDKNGVLINKELGNITIFSDIKHTFSLSKYVYTNLGHDIYMPIGVGNIESVKKHDCPMDVSVDERLYFSNADIIFSKDNSMITLGQCITITGFPSITCQAIGKQILGKVHINRRGTIEEFLKGLYFLKAASEGKRIRFGKITTSTIEKNKNWELSKTITFYEKIKKLFCSLKIEGIVRLESINESEFPLLEKMYEGVVLQKYFKWESTKQAQTIESFRIGNINVGIILWKKDDKWYKFSNLFSGQRFILKTKTQDGKDVEASGFTIVDRNCLLNWENVDCSVIKESIYEIPNNQYSLGRNECFFFEVLQAYDQNKKKEFLCLAHDIVNWLKKYNNTIYTMLNYYQVIFRERKYTIEEEEKLRLLQETNDMKISLAVAILLHNEGDIVYYLSRIPEKENFLKYPIANLIPGKILAECSR